MNFFQVIILSVVQGLTEFLPVSSSGHLVIFQKIFGFNEPPVLFDVLLHVGTLGAVIIYFRQGLIRILRDYQKERGLIGLVILGTVPAGIVGILFEKQVDTAFNSLVAVGWGLIFTSLLLFSTKFIKNANRQLKKLDWLDAIFVGLLQAVAILPGVSRSGSTIVAGLWRRISPKDSFVFSFYLSIPAIFGALILKAKDLRVYSPADLIYGLFGMVLAGLVGFYSLKILEMTLKSARFFWFGVYCLILGVVLLLV